MSGKTLLPVAVIIALTLLAAGAGCTSALVGDVTYQDNALIVPVTCDRDGGDAFVQVTVYEIRDFHQQEVQYLQKPVTLHKGTNTVIVPATLPPGSYKLYIYILTPGERQTATIRDITV